LIPQFISILLFLVTAIVNKTVPTNNIEGYENFKEEISSNLFAKHWRYMTIVFVLLWFFNWSIIWICYMVFFYIMIANNHNVKNWISAIIVSCALYIHLRHSIQKLPFAWAVLIFYSGIVFLSTWIMNFLNFKYI